MPLEYRYDQHKEYLDMCDRIGSHWLGVFKGDTDFYSAAYWDLLTELWRRAEPVRKSEALRLMKAIKSAHTAGRYMDFALAKGFILEVGNPDDARSKLVMLSPETREHLDKFFDRAVAELKRSSEAIDAAS